VAVVVTLLRKDFEANWTSVGRHSFLFWVTNLRPVKIINGLFIITNGQDVTPILNGRRSNQFIIRIRDMSILGAREPPRLPLLGRLPLRPRFSHSIPPS
jgi:hypothetical protein